MHVDLEKIKKLPPDVRRDFYKMYLKYGEKKKQSNIKQDFLILCALCSIAFFCGMKIGEDNEKVKHMNDKLQRE